MSRDLTAETAVIVIAVLSVMGMIGAVLGYTDMAVGSTAASCGIAIWLLERMRH